MNHFQFVPFCYSFRFVSHFLSFSTPIQRQNVTFQQISLWFFQRLMIEFYGLNESSFSFSKSTNYCPIATMSTKRIENCATISQNVKTMLLDRKQLMKKATRLRNVGRAKSFDWFSLSRDLYLIGSNISLFSIQVIAITFLRISIAIGALYYFRVTNDSVCFSFCAFAH